MATNPFDAAEVQAALGGRYVIGPELRVGGQGVVYRATRIHDGVGIICNDNTAIKLHLDSAQDERVEREIKAVKDLRHRALATLLEDGVVDIRGKRIRYITWEFIEGEPLDARLARGPLTERETAQVAHDVASAISVLWSKRIVHRDIAPKNIMLTPDGRAVLIDLGGARHLDNSTITAPGATFGTPGYFSPEQCRAEHALTSASDIFTLGVVMLECLLGRHPTNCDQNGLLHPLSVTLLIPNVSQNLRKTIEGMLQLRAPFRPRVAQLEAEFRGLLNVR